MPSKLTSYDNATVGSGAVVNEVQFAYNGFAQRTRDYQSHAGSVNLSSTPQVQLTYAGWPSLLQAGCVAQETLE